MRRIRVPGKAELKLMARLIPRIKKISTNFQTAGNFLPTHRSETADGVHRLPLHLPERAPYI
jgi:hypothetical protein